MALVFIEEGDNMQAKEKAADMQCESSYKLLLEKL